ncbi:glutaredoxin family protein [Cytobacillus sp. Hz8]|uniref:glutaredoxin family protein n=1 Tax=Cytobacillus sp. Hz8 TaxID=3347168 RepID=UPI0035D74A8F
MGKPLSVVVWSKEGCHYCAEVKAFLEEKEIPYQTVDVTYHDEFRDILEIKYGVRYVPVVEIGNGETYRGVTEIGVEHLQRALQESR